MPNLDIYNGSADPMDYLNHLREHLSLQGLDEMTMYQYFHLTLKDNAIVWFYRLPANSIHSFSELATSFLSQFTSNQRMEKQP
ncbi:hypothetical protein Nepgr_015300 [Nepenthes gracilis]|uniref:Retrotransposon gag domain-containing protein n=1 Tax=Nepenthes gracilis TaxID=150966 RepID=A0AAD3SMK7_NEPGR|nr:hypothetical protein Nepgr_015300 [Nepenthes gracilis]